jgi:hypothetical protein
VTAVRRAPKPGGMRGRKPTPPSHDLIGDLERHLGTERLATLTWLEMHVTVESFTTSSPLKNLALALGINVLELRGSLDLPASPLTVPGCLRYYAFLHLTVRVAQLTGSLQQAGIWFTRLHSELNMTPLEAFRQTPHILEEYLEGLEVEALV